MWTGQDWAFLLGGVTVLVTGLGGFITSMVTLVRVGEVATKVDGMLVQRDASNIAAGEIMGRKAGDDAAEQRAAGRREERETQRDTVALAPHPSGVPVPVADDRVAIATEKTAAANERIADATENKSQ